MGERPPRRGKTGSFRPVCINARDHLAPQPLKPLLVVPYATQAERPEDLGIRCVGDMMLQHVNPPLSQHPVSDHFGTPLNALAWTARNTANRAGRLKIAPIALAGSGPWSFSSRSSLHGKTSKPSPGQPCVGGRPSDGRRRGRRSRWHPHPSQENPRGRRGHPLQHQEVTPLPWLHPPAMGIE